MTTQFKPKFATKTKGNAPVSANKSYGRRDMEAPTENRGVKQAPADPRRATRPPEKVPSARSFAGDKASSTKAVSAHYAHRPIVRGTMHSRKPREGIRPGDGEMPSVRSGAHLDDEND